MYLGEGATPKPRRIQPCVTGAIFILRSKPTLPSVALNGRKALGVSFHTWRVVGIVVWDMFIIRSYELAPPSGRVFMLNRAWSRTLVHPLRVPVGGELSDLLLQYPIISFY